MLVDVANNLNMMRAMKTGKDATAFDVAKTQIGHDHWRETYRRRPNDDQYAQIHSALQVSASLGGVTPSPIDIFGVAALAKWVDGACRTIVTTSEYFAAMAATKISAETFVDVHVPWPAFVVRIPPGILVGADGVTYERAVVAQLSNVTSQGGTLGADGEPVGLGPRQDVGVLHLYPNDTSIQTTIGTWSDKSLADLLFNAQQQDDPDSLSSTILPLGDDEVRLLECARRAIVGLLYTMEHTTDFRDEARPKSRSLSANPRFGPPDHRVMVVGRPLKKNVSDRVRNYIVSGGRGALSFQCVVSGHYKRQSHGPRNTLRKVIWVPPHWRGPEDAAILVRPYEIDGTELSV